MEIIPEDDPLGLRILPSATDLQRFGGGSPNAIIFGKFMYDHMMGERFAFVSEIDIAQKCEDKFMVLLSSIHTEGPKFPKYHPSSS